MPENAVPATMRAVVLDAYDGVSLRVEERPTPQPGPGEVLVRMVAGAINPSDLMFVRGMYGVRKPLPAMPGFEGSGTVVAAGGGVWARALLGRRVACSSGETSGTWAEYNLVPAGMCVPLLPQVGTLQGAMLIVNPLTAWALVDIARRGDHGALIQTAAASALGRMVVRLCQRFGLPLINVVRRPAQVELLRGLGAEHVLDSSAPDFDERLRNLARELRATIAIDAVAGELTGRLIQLMPRGARVLIYGALSEEECLVPPGALIFRGAQVEGFWLTNWLATLNPAALLRGAVSVQQLLAADLRSEVRACFPIEEARQAIELYSATMTAGKVLLMPGLRRNAS
ncbi:MAG TPA: zinc-binding dehydrogenase [Roseiflexaceae bacterium]|nr:zinc-binding dehydrogenase [Roseiflexaceae bacterium]